VICGDAVFRQIVWRLAYTRIPNLRESSQLSPNWIQMKARHDREKKREGEPERGEE